MKYIENKNLNLLSINFIIPVGNKTIFNNKINKFAHLIEHLIFHGSSKYTQYELLFKIEELGGIFNAQTNDYYTELYLRITEDNVIEAIELILDALIHFDISEDDYNSEVEIIKIEDKQANSNVDFIVDTMLTKCLNHVKNDNIPSFNDIIKIYKNIYNNWSLVIMGKLEKTKIEKIRNLVNDEGEPKYSFSDNLLYKHLDFKYKFINKALDKNDNLFLYVFRCSDKTDTLTMKLIKNIYVNGLSSILYDKLVSDFNYCYNINFRDYSVHNNFFIIYFTHDNNSNLLLSDAKKLFVDVFNIKYINSLKSTDIKRAVNMVITEAYLKFERSSAQINDTIDNYLFERDVTITNNYLDKLKSMSEEDIKLLLALAIGRE
ncbi:insulinase family protein [Sedimentibacter sp. zth1]|uniref:M16 family metallopeptidase n=1 Tax=Sedimentibacter sp. zth1 TaxID=2816908 RepID=UPI001A91C07E|nr:insulinase family protein [Sedimentibacter sp. zth1]QSX05002.1 insulinase family protein [Sedimentibacter sp. zth1]